MKPFLIGCGVILLLIVGAVIAGFIFLPDMIKKGMEMAEEAIAAEQERQTLATNWTPPLAGDTAEEVFPAQLGTYKRTAADESTGIPELTIKQPGLHAVYGSGASKVDAYVFPVTPAQRLALINSVESLNKGQGSTSWVKIDLGDDFARIHFTSGTLGSNYLWFTKTHLVVFRTTDTEDREAVLKAFFTARQAAAPAATGIASPTATGTKPKPKSTDPDADPDAAGAPSKDGSVRFRPAEATILTLAA